jgi:hypothetical protein
MQILHVKLQVLYLERGLWKLPSTDNNYAEKKSWFQLKKLVFKHTCWAGGVVQAGEHLLFKNKAPSSNPSPTNK